ncbi:ribonuclease III [Parerythrobacter aurantius]|uniref:ribonuclease III n=1 Tax=Parerythrobacter aurantius TaxID=3127706 RepID=UPI003252500F
MTSLAPTTREWLAGIGFTVTDDELWLEALTHGSTGALRDYQRLEFLGDRVLGLAISDHLYRNVGGAEGALAQRLNALVSKGSCARVARQLGVCDYVVLGKQAREDGAAGSTNIMGDVMESLLGANYLEAGYAATALLVHRFWEEDLQGKTGRSKHPKSALQEWAAGNQRRPPEYRLVDRSGPDHAAVFTVRVEVRNVGAAEASANSKQEAETAAAKLFMEQFG